MTNQSRSELLPFVATLAVLALIAILAIGKSRQNASFHSANTPDAETFAGTFDQGSMEAMWEMSHR